MGIKINFTNVPKFKTVDDVQQYLISLQNQIQNYENLISHHIHKGGLNDFGQILSSYVSGLKDGSGASGYFKIGNMLIQWGTGTTAVVNSYQYSGGWSTSNQFGPTYPVAFKVGTVPVFLPSMFYPQALPCSFILDTITATVATVRISAPMNDGNTYTYFWMAIGVWQ